MTQLDEDRSWMVDANCAGTSSKLWYRETITKPAWADLARERQAKAWCERCIVRRECLTYALTLERAGYGQIQDQPVFLMRQRDADGKVVREWFQRRVFTTSHTPPAGIWGGFLPHERHARSVKHHEGCSTKDCGGCRPVEERVSLLLEGGETWTR